jgi:hypothetical protein
LLTGTQVVITITEPTQLHLKTPHLMENQRTLRTLLLATILLLQAAFGTAQTPNTTAACLPHVFENTTWQLTSTYILVDSQDGQHSFDVVPVFQPTTAIILGVHPEATGGLRINLVLQDGTQGYILVPDLQTLAAELHPIQPEQIVF